MKHRIVILIAALSLLPFFSCDESGTGPDTGEGNNGTSNSSGLTLYLFETALLEPHTFNLIAYNAKNKAPSDTFKMNRQFRDLAVSDNKLFLVLDKDSIFVINKDTPKEATDPYQDTLWLPGEIFALQADSNVLWILSDQPGTPVAKAPQLIRFDTQSLTETSRCSVTTVNASLNENMIVTDNAIYILVNNNFSLVKVDRGATGVEWTLPLGEDPNDPDGPRAEKYGYGDFAITGDTCWVFDTYKDKILRVNLSTASVEEILPMNNFFTTPPREIFGWESSILAYWNDNAGIGKITPTATGLEVTKLFEQLGIVNQPTVSGDYLAVQLTGTRFGVEVYNISTKKKVEDLELDLTFPIWMYLHQ